MTTIHARMLWLVITGAAILSLGGCGAARAGDGVGPDGERAGSEVIFSVANKDRQTPATVMKVLVDDKPLIFGALQLAGQGGYLYVSTNIPGRTAELRVVSEAEGEAPLVEERTLMLEDRLWIVITRLRDIDGGPELEIEVSYERPAVSPGEI